MAIQIDYEKCCWKNGKCTSCACGGTCDGCVEVCPAGALERRMSLEWNSDLCTDCGLCIEACKYKALSLIN